MSVCVLLLSHFLCTVTISAAKLNESKLEQFLWLILTCETRGGPGRKFSVSGQTCTKQKIGPKAFNNLALATGLNYAQNQAC
jgi:hypothetical protein